VRGEHDVVTVGILRVRELLHNSLHPYPCPSIERSNQRLQRRVFQANRDRAVLRLEDHQVVNDSGIVGGEVPVANRDIYQRSPAGERAHARHSGTGGAGGRARRGHRCLVLARNPEQLRHDVVANRLGRVECFTAKLGLGVVAEGKRSKSTRGEHGIDLHHREVDHLAHASIE